MTPATYDALNDAAMDLYQQQRFAEVLDLLTREGDRFPEQAFEVLYLRSCMAARTAQPALALALIQEALDRGLWFGEELIRRTPSWQGLQGDPAFERLAALSIARQA